MTASLPRGEARVDAQAVSQRPQEVAGGTERPPEGDIFEALFQSEKAVQLILGQAPVHELVNRLAYAAECAFPSARCAISLFDGSGRSRHLALPELLADVSVERGDLHAEIDAPTHTAMRLRERVVVSDLKADRRWPGHAARAVRCGLSACWAEPISCGDDLLAVLTLYFPDVREPDARDGRVLRALAGFLGSLITAAHRQHALRSVAQRFESLIGAVPGVLYQRVVKPDGQIRYTYISPGARELFGASPEAIMADPEVLFSRHASDYAANFRERLLAASKSLTTWDVKATLIAADGRKKYTHAVARPERLADGSVLWTGIILDETRSREALFESLPQGVLLFDAEDRLVIRNTHFVHLYPALHDIAVPGARYEDIVYGELASTSNAQAGRIDRAAKFRERIEQHRHDHSIFEHQLDDERCIIVKEDRTSDGGTVVVYTDVSELKQREREIHRLAYYDSLTGLPNRLLFKQRVEEALVQAETRGKGVAVLCLDVDHFKNVNDSLGHSAGDALLKITGERINGLLRSIDTVARLGGDEFGVVIADVHQPGYVGILAQRVLAAISEPAEINGQPVNLGVSVGVAISTTDAHDAEGLLKKAELALFRAKGDGRGTFRFFEAAMDARAQARRALEVDLRRAMAKNQLELYYQPQVDTQTNRMVGFEALLRWQHPTQGLISPAEFVPLAEDTGIITSLGEWALRQACADAMTWPSDIKLAVNVSPAQFRHRDLATLVAAILKETGLPAGRLELEITESLLLRDVEATLRTLQELKALGVRISMDDFGTGYSSLGNLRSFPFDKIKIDRSFVKDLGRNADSTAIVRAVLGLGRSLGIATCAEGVETDEQLARLRSEGCREVQGFLYGGPRPAAEIAEWFRRERSGH